MAAPRPSAPPLPGAIGVHLPAFKRKRIEQWCEDVAHYLKAGSLCRSVIGHVIEDNRIPASATGTKSAPASSSHQRTSTTSSIGTITEMLSLNNSSNSANINKKENGVGNGSNNHNTSSACISVTKIDTMAPPPVGRSTPMPDTSGPLPVVKFSYGHYNEQRRRIDRLVQGLPVLSASPAAPNPGSALERLGGGAAVIYVNGEEPVRHPGFAGSAGSRERQSRSPGPGPDPKSASRSSSGEPRQRPSRPAHPSRHKSVSPSPPCPLPLPASSSQHHGVAGVHHPSSSTVKPASSEIVVIEHDFHHQHDPTHHSIDYKATGFRPTNFDGSNELRRSQSQKVHKARQRMLASTRRSRDQNHHVTPTHVPVQSCWAMAELTW